MRKKVKNSRSFFKLYAARRNKIGMNKAHQRKIGVPARYRENGMTRKQAKMKNNGFFVRIARKEKSIAIKTAGQNNKEII